MSHRTLPAAALLAAALAAPGVTAGVVEGLVTGVGGAPVPGALVTLTRADGLYAETVYTDAAGAYRLATALAGEASLRVRRPFFADAETTVSLGAGANIEHDVALRPLESAAAISAQLPASAHYTRLEFDDATAKGFFAIECLTCHQLGNAYTRAPRSSERWRAIVTRMLGFFQITDEERIERYAARLEAGFDGEPLVIEQTHPVDPALYEARMRQWKLPGAVIAHDVEHHSRDGRFYTVDQGRDLIYITDPRTNETQTYEIPDGGIPIGGKFLEVFDEPNPFSLAVRRGPHSLKEGPDGHYYTTDTVSGQIGEFDPVTRTYTGHDIGGRAMYPHTIRFDEEGFAWFTIGVSNQVGRFDPRTGDMLRIDLPDTTDRPEIPVLMPYGIDVHPEDGSIWYSRLMANRIGRIDRETLKVQEFRPPLIGPRRLRFGADGTLWIPSYGTGELVALDTGSMEYTSYRIPTLSGAETEAPYAVAVHPDTGDVWITANMSDRMFRFLPQEKRFIAYPLPTRGIFLRDVTFTPAGEVCAASSMAAAPLAVEGGMEEIICLAPGG